MGLSHPLQTLKEEGECHQPQNTDTGADRGYIQIEAVLIKANHEGEEAAETSGLESWQKGMETEVKTGRFDYWLPREGGLSEYGVEAGDEMLREMGWLHSMLAGRAIGPRQ